MSNRLAYSQSLYLRKHADNPVDWWPWCEEALDTARQEDKPFFIHLALGGIFDYVAGGFHLRIMLCSLRPYWICIKPL